MTNLKNGKELQAAEPEPITLDDACLFLNLSRSTLYKLIHKGKIPYYKPNGKKIYFKKSELSNWVFRNPVKIQLKVEDEA